jgi:hypothetical protein
MQSDATRQAGLRGRIRGRPRMDGEKPGAAIRDINRRTRRFNDPAGTNVAQIIMAGAQRHHAVDSNNKPDFGDSYSDVEIASVANYVTARFLVPKARISHANFAKLRVAD